MKIHELITRLQNFPMDTEVFCLHESSTWAFDDELGHSVEIDSVAEGPVKWVEKYEDGYTMAVIIK